jgi:hypothetical protein
MLVIDLTSILKKILEDVVKYNTDQDDPMNLNAVFRGYWGVMYNQSTNVCDEIPKKLNQDKTMLKSVLSMEILQKKNWPRPIFKLVALKYYNRNRNG